MTIRVLVSVLIALVAVSAIYFLATDIYKTPEYFSKNIRASLFTGFLTMGSFMMSIKAFIVVKLKENVFDSTSYKERLQQLRKIDSSLTLYGPVQRLSTLLFVSICSAIAASVSQLSIGLIDSYWAVLFCAFIASFAISMLVFTLFVISKILKDWLQYLEDAHTKSGG